MANSEYSVDEILAEIKRKKEGKTVSAVPETKRNEPGESFFEKRQKKAEPVSDIKQAPTYTNKYKDEPVTTRTIQVDDTLSQYFGPTEWKNGKKPKEQRDTISSKVVTVPAHEAKVEKKDEPVSYEPKDISKHSSEKVSEKTEKGYAKEAAVTEVEEKREETVSPIPKPIANFAENEKAESKPEKKFELPVNGFGINKEESKKSEPAIPETVSEPAKETPEEKEQLTDSKNRDLYKEFTEKRKDKVEEFMKLVAEPTNQEIHVPEVPEHEPVKNKFTEEENSEIAKEVTENTNYFEEDESDDFEDVSQKGAVKAEITSQITSSIIRIIILLIFFAASMVLCLSPALGYELPEFIAFSKSGIVFPIINLGLVVLSALTCHMTVGGGLISLFRLRACNDTFAACSVIGSTALGVYYVAQPSAMASGGQNLIFPVVILGLLFNLVGKLFRDKRILNNFEVLTDGKERSALLPVHNKELARELTGQSDEVPRLCVGAKSDFFVKFLDYSYRDDSTESIARFVAPVIFVCSIVIGAVAFLLTADISEAITGFAEALVISAPFAATICGALPVLRSCRELNKQGSVMTGGYSAETLAEANSVLVDIEELFPEGSIVLHGIKTFAKGRIDEAILDAASVICSTKSTIGSIFLNVVQGDRSLLRPVDTIIYEDEMGLSAWVEGKRVLIGNRDLMINHGVDIPSHDYEEKYVGGGKDILYLSNSGELTAMFVLSYHADKEVYHSLGVMANRGISLVINCSDPNITAAKLSKIFDYPENQLKILSSKYQQKCAELTEKREKAPSSAVFDGSLSSLSDLLNCCGIIRQSSFAASLVELIGIVLGFILVTFFLFTGSISTLPMYAILIFQIFWLLAVVLVTVFRKSI